MENNIFENWHGDVDERIKDHRPVFDKKAVEVCLHERLDMCWNLSYIQIPYMITRLTGNGILLYIFMCEFL